MNELLSFIYKEQKELSNLGGVAALLGWDQMTYMPQLGATERSEQLSLISRISHEKFTSDKLYDLVKKFNEPAMLETLNEKDKTVINRLCKDIEKSRKVPSDFVEKMAKTTTLAHSAWEKARNECNYSLFASPLEKIIELERQYCDYINLAGHMYNSLLDSYEEGMTVDTLKAEFSKLKSELVLMLEKIKSSQLYQRQQDLKVHLTVEQQKKICNLIIADMNLPNDRFRLDVSTHPFTTSMGNDDVRITTNYARKSPLFSFFSTIHEAGHALYELGLPRNDYKDTVISDAPSLGIHESQSRFWENMIARSTPFWNKYFSVFQKNAEGQLTSVSVEDWYKRVNQVKPSLIRVEADELTYCLHVILRFELELDIIDDKINVSELPGCWNDKMDDFLGVMPKNDVDGVLQDMHWSGGSFGYFPTYAIGSIYASQLYHQLVEEKTEVNSDIENGDFEQIIAWLRDNVHCYGRLLTAEEIITKCCGEGLNAEVFVKYLKDKYYKLYDI